MKSKRIHSTPSGYDHIPANQLVIGLDVSSSAAGWCVAHANDRGNICFDNFGRIKPTSSWSAERRMEKIAIDIGNICKDFSEHRNSPVRVVMEWQSHLRAAKLRNANGLAVLGRAQGVVWWHLKMLGYQIDLTSERLWTKIDGRNISKEKRASRIRMLCPQYRDAVSANSDLDSGLDIADAIGLCVWRFTL